MTIIELTTRNDLPAYQYVTALDGTTYQINLVWNSRMDNGNGKWMLSLADAFGNPLIGAVPVIANWPLIKRFVFDGLPPGVLFAFDTSGQDMDPGRFDLGDRVRLFYQQVAS
jgi:hypothetical protein